MLALRDLTSDFAPIIGLYSHRESIPMKALFHTLHCLWSLQVLASAPEHQPKHNPNIAEFPQHQHNHELSHLALRNARGNPYMMASSKRDKPIRAMIYRGKSATEQCPESVARLLKSTFPNRVKVTYAGPDEAVKINAQTLSHVDLFAQPGGPDVDEAWLEVQTWAPALRSFVSSGGRYVGFCLGGYLAGHDPGYSLLPKSDNVSQEIEEPGSQVDDEDDTIIQVDWAFSTGKKSGKTESKRWLYFQDGPMFELAEGSEAKVLGRYSSTGDAAAVLNGFGEGWVGNVGPHPEADKAWYDDEEITNPEGVKFDVGHDLLRALMEAK